MSIFYGYVGRVMMRGFVNVAIGVWGDRGGVITVKWHQNDGLDENKENGHATTI